MTILGRAGFHRRQTHPANADEPPRACVFELRQKPATVSPSPGVEARGEELVLRQIRC